MSKTTESGDMPDFAIPGIIIIGIQLVLIKRITAIGTPVIILAKTVDPDNTFSQIRDQIETSPTPFTAPGAEDKPFWDPIFLTAPKIICLPWRRLSSSLGQVPKDISVLF